MRVDSPDLRAWVLVLLVQSLPYTSAVIASVISALPIPADWIGRGYVPVAVDEEYATVVPEPQEVAADDAPPALVPEPECARKAS
jgi:hypothetical protein